MNCRKARNLGPGSEGIMEMGSRSCVEGRRGAEEQGRGPRAFRALGLEGPPRIPKCESVSHEESRPQAGPLIFLLPFSSGFRNLTDALTADCLPGVLLSSALAFLQLLPKIGSVISITILLKTKLMLREVRSLV